MPETIDPKTPALPANANANNEAVARKLAAQDAAGNSTVPDAKGIADASSALDALAKVAEDASKETPPVVTAPAEPTAEEVAAKEKADSAARAAAEEKKRADDFFKDSPQLPPNASVKSVEAFSTIKLKAAQEISKLQQELDAAKKQAQELEQKTKTPPPELEATKKELEDLRQWRAKLDVDADPKFKEFDAKMEKSRQTIYDLLKESPVVTEKVIEQIKSFGGPDKSDLTKLFEAMKDPTLQRMVETKVLDIKTAHIEKEQAIRETKQNVSQWLEEKTKAQATEKTSRLENTKRELDGFLGGIDWFKERQPDAKATDAEKKAIAADNELVKQLRGELGAAISDDSPRTKAILLTGLVQLTRLQKVHETTLAELAAATKELETTKAFVEKIKTSSTSRLRESGAPVDGKMPEKKTDIFNTPAVSALDTLAREIGEQRRAQGK